MLEEVSEAGPSATLVRRADVIPDVHRDDRHTAILVKDHGQPVRQREQPIGNFECGEWQADGSSGTR